MQEAHPVRAQQIHVYNCTPLINRIMSLIRPLIKPEVAARFQFHTPGSETIFKFIPREILPEEYGGDAGPIQTIADYWMTLFMEKRLADNIFHFSFIISMILLLQRVYHE